MEDTNEVETMPETKGSKYEIHDADNGLSDSKDSETCEKVSKPNETEIPNICLVRVLAP